MVERKLIGTKRNNGKSLKHVKPSKYIDMVIDALYSLKDRKGSVPKNIVGYISNSYKLTSDKKTIASNIYRALKQGLETNLILKNSQGHYNLAAKGKQRRKFPAKRSRKRRRGRRKGRKKRKGRKRRKKRRKGRKKGRKGKRRKSRRRSRRHKKSKRTKHGDESDD